MGKQKTLEQRKRAAEQIVGGKPIRDALLENGWSAKQARKGRAALGKEMNRLIDKALEKEASKLTRINDRFDAPSRKKLILGRLVENVLRREDKAVQSLKLLGQDSELSMWQPEERSGVIVLQVSQPNTGKELPTIDGEMISPKSLEE